MQRELAYSFEGSNNFRDLGGYEVKGKKHIKRGLIIRGARLYDLTEGDRIKFNSMGIKTVFDLRSKTEADAFPNYKVPGAENIRMSAMNGPEGEEIDFTPGNLERNFGEINEKVFTRIYIQTAFSNKAYRLLFEYLLEGKSPLFFHCSSGKDRTGIAAMIILLALGASSEDALYDYTLTNKYNEPQIKALLKERGIDPNDSKEVAKIMPLYGVLPFMAEETIDAIFKRYSTIEEYMKSEYDFDEKKLEKLRNMYTE